MITVEQLKKLYETTPIETIQKYIDVLNSAMGDNDIDTPSRISMFLAQIGAESGGLTITQENLNYRASGLLATFGTHFSGPDEANLYAHQPERIGNRVYANRMGNGPESSGDGFRYRGRGFIQITGKENYTAFAIAMGMSLEDIVSYMEIPQGACDSAAWYWTTRNLNLFADAGDNVGCTRKINGGLNGLDLRNQLYTEAKQIFS